MSLPDARRWSEVRRMGWKTRRRNHRSLCRSGWALSSRRVLNVAVMSPHWRESRAWTTPGRAVASGLQRLPYRFAQVTPSGNTQLFHPELQGRPVQSQAHGGALRSGENPLRRFQSCQDQLALGVFQSLVLSLLGSRMGARAQALERDV